MKAIFVAVMLCLWCGVGRAEDHEAWKQIQPALSKLLNDAAARIDKVEGKEADIARYRLATALAKSGDYAAARKLAARLKDTDLAGSAWTTIGQMQGWKGRDRAAAADSFARAVEAARRREPGSFDQRSAYSDIVAAQARSGDIEGALRFARGLDDEAKQKSLTRLARIAARRGIEAPATALLQVARDETEKSEALSLRALAVAAREGDVPAARAALAKVTEPLHKVPVLLELFDNPLGGKRGDPTLLDEALAAVAQNKPAPSAFGFHDVENDAARGAIALRQLRVGTEPGPAIAKAKATLEAVKLPDNAQKYIETFCEKLALEDLPTVLAFAQRLAGEQRVAALSAIVRGLGRRLSAKRLEPRPELRKTVEELVNQALAAANELGESDRRWAGVPVARALAEAGEFPAAYQVANSIDQANQRAYAFASIARSAIENQRGEQAREALKKLEAAALTEKQPESAARIIGQATLAITEPLLGDEPADVASAMAGLE